MTLPRELGSNKPEHDPADPRCIAAEESQADEAHTCQLCATNEVREQAAVAINARELGS